MKKITAAILALVLLVGICSVAYARYTYIDMMTAGLSISGGTAKCSGSVAPHETGHTSSITMTLKQKVGGVWVTYKGPWSATGTGLGGASVTKSVSVEKGYQYKVTVTGKVQTESDTMDSPIKSY